MRADTTPSAQADLLRLAELLSQRRPAARPQLVGITGSVAAGKSVLAANLAEHLAAGPDRPRVEIVATDGFLHPNAKLEELGVLAQKGFPPSYDHEALAVALTTIRQGPAVFPGYSHVTYDIDPGLARTLAPPDVLIVEGLSLPPAGAPALLDALVYLDAAEADLEAWYLRRFLGLWEAAEHDPTSFYARFRQMSRDEVTALARTVWERVNLRNLRDHILPARALAHIVVRKGPDHGIVEIQSVKGEP
jgi:type I pantothenate kinase